MKKISFVSLVVFLLDRITKILVTNYFELDTKNEIINNFFYITNCHNTGAAFSLFSGNILFLILISLVMLYLIFRTLKHKRNISVLSAISYGLLLGGVFGNLVDRLIYGYVIDFLDFIIFGFNFAIFNLADVAIVCGALMLVFFEGSDKYERENQNRCN